MPSPKPATYDINYKFTFKDGSIKEVSVQLDSKTLAIKPKARSSYPEWTRLTHSQCPNCPLKEDKHPQCPIAANLVDLIGLFKDHVSYEKVQVEVSTPPRTYSKLTPLAEAISSLIGIYMVSSGCPILDKLKPMVRTHLPFATWEETLYRMLSAYLMAQYFLYKEGREPDWHLDKITAISNEINIVNQAFCERLHEIHLRDATLNAVVQLDCFANLTGTFVKENRINEIQAFFDAYLK
jgi:hypothetical protein